jgi:hypothetical protein
MNPSGAMIATSPASDGCLVNHTFDAAEVIGMRMRVDDGFNRTPAAVLVIEFQRRFCRLGGG